MSTFEAQASLAWFKGAIASEFVAAMEPSEHPDGGLSLGWSGGGLECTAIFNPNGSLVMCAEQLGDDYDEWAATIAAPGPGDEKRVRDFYLG